MGDNSVEPDAVTGARERPKASNVRRVVVCTGQVYYKLQQLRMTWAKGANDVALVRLEQLSPFPHAALARRLARYPNAELVWCQEEPKNMGYWAFAQPRINTAVREILEVDRGRARRRSTATTTTTTTAAAGTRGTRFGAPERAGVLFRRPGNGRDEVRRVRIRRAAGGGVARRRVRP